MEKAKERVSDILDLWLRRIFLMITDGVILSVAGYLALWIRYEFVWSSIEQKYIETYNGFLLLHMLAALIIFWLFRLYHSLWQFAGSKEIFSICCACFSLMIADVCLITFTDSFLPRSYYLISFVFTMIGCGGIRFLYRYLRQLRRHYRHIKEGKHRNIMIVGAGEAGTMIIKEIKLSKYVNGTVRCVIDDDRKKHGYFIHGVRIVGGRYAIPDSVKKYNIDQIIIAMPAQSKKTIKEILDICKETGCELKTLPGIYQLVNNEVQVSQLRNVEINDLLGREPIIIHSEEIQEYLEGKTVLVTGGGGSIGSELCRQIAARNPGKLIIFDIYENSAYEIQQELIRKYPKLDLLVLIGSVRSRRRMKEIFSTYKPDIVYHAAAHKHVPLMEDSPAEAIKNNVFGTLRTVQAADDYGTERFVMISTDKAVNPTNIMGASKRLCEMIIQMYNRRSKTEFVAVRFGNVLGSNGSVIPLFKKQIEQGGPVTVTHRDIIRYFMTIPEAVSLVLQAGAYAKGGEIFVLDMGDPVKIADLAKNLILLSGLKPGEDIEIVYTGLRPGEKLYEELLMDEEGMQDTENKLIHIGRPIEFDDEQFEKDLEELWQATEEKGQDIRALVKKIVPTYKPEV